MDLEAGSSANTPDQEHDDITTSATETMSTLESPPPGDVDTAEQGSSRRQLARHARKKRRVDEKHLGYSDVSADTPLEMPTAECFIRHGPIHMGLDIRHFEWGPRPVSALSKLPGRAAPPIRPKTIDLMRRDKAPERQSLSETYVSEQSESELEAETYMELPHTGDSGRACLGACPAEVREVIFRELLVSHGPMYVFDDWSMVHRHSRQTPRPALQTSILRVCKQFFWEGVRILYGQNRFIYRLRDQAAVASTPEEMPEPEFEQQMMDHGFEEAPGEQSDDGDYEDEELEEGGDEDDDVEDVYDTNNTLRSDSCRRDIYTKKYACLIRNIVVEAEQTHADELSMIRMAEAISVFAHPPPVYDDTIPVEPRTEDGLKDVENKNETPLSRIRTLSVRVHPRFMNSGHVTFENFFRDGCPVVKAICDLLPQFLHVEVITRHLKKDGIPVRMRLDMRPWRIVRSVEESNGNIHRHVWHTDKAAWIGRAQRAWCCRKAFDGLQGRVQSCCRRYMWPYMWPTELEGVDDIGLLGENGI